MAPEVASNTAQIITAIGTAIAAIGTVVVAVFVQLQRRTLGQVERQGNSVALELKRVNSVYARRLAEATKAPADIAVANETSEVYEAALKQSQL